ncbi:hypothetical protein STA3757_08340 [Stanieria sp. NIES-3757]|nr:hypothetical protein STA3757_08340 [Stanieria sp. NIES-3757]
MLEYRQNQNSNLIGIKVDGKITKNDFTELVHKLEAAINNYGQIRILLEFIQMQGLEASAFWEDLRFSLTHFKDISRYAVVGEQTWLQAWTTLVKPFLPCEIKYFKPNELEEAWHWLESSTSFSED